MENSRKIDELIEKVKQATIETDEITKTMQQMIIQLQEARATTKAYLNTSAHILSQLERPEETQNDKTREPESNNFKRQ